MLPLRLCALLAIGQYFIQAVDGSCPDLPKLNVLPGHGWCNLRNKEMEQVFSITYSSCKTTPDGLFLIPDNSEIVPALESQVQLFSEIIDSWQNYSSSTARSINLNADASTPHFSISGSFSEEHQHCKESQVDLKSVTTRVEARYVLYTVVASVDSPLHPELISKLDNVFKAKKSGNQVAVDYLLELIVREYGTHVETRIDAGALIAQEEYISRDYKESKEASSETISAGASARFFSLFGFSAKFSTTTNTSVIQGYEHNLKSSKVNSYGGMLLKPGNMSIDAWVDSIPTHLVAVDREGNGLHFVVTPYQFPDESLEMVDTIRLELQNAIGRYYSYNKHVGCMSLDSKNFDYFANIQNNVCSSPTNNYTFGGVYQTVVLPNLSRHPYVPVLSHKNILTGDYSCPRYYNPVKLMSYSGNVCRSPLERWWFGSACIYQAETYWCAVANSTEIEPNTGLMFGGLFSSTTDNPVTHSKSCPPTFIEATMFDDLHICIGNDYELGGRFKAAFGGFFSCQSGNPLYDRKDLLTKRKSLAELNAQGVQACPAGHTQHTASVFQQCQISYCVKAGSFALHGDMPVILPPFKNYTGIFSHVNPISQGISGWFIGLIVGGVLMVVILSGVIGWRIWKRRRTVNNDNVDPNDNEEANLLLANENNDNENVIA